MDLDVDMAGISNTEDKGGEGDWVMVNETDDGQEHISGGQLSKAASAESLAEPTDPDAAPASNVDSGATPSMFDTAEFGGFDNLDTAGDALADYTAEGDDLGLDLDNSAFGDAFHGTETHHGEIDDGENA
jgi:Fungal domain of unknown function (DUF1750)